MIRAAVALARACAGRPRPDRRNVARGERRPHDRRVRVPPDRLPLVTLAALFVGYACSYCHRADLPALAPLWASDGVHGALRDAWPDIASLGMLIYACGKVLGGLLAERLGGRRVFVAALAGAGVAEFVALHVDAPVPFACCRVFGMLVLGCAWPALGHVVATVTPYMRLATVMAFLSQSYLVGDAAVRALFAAVVARGGGAHAVLGTATAGLLGAAAVVGGVLWFAGGRTSAVAARAPAPAAAAAGATSAVATGGPPANPFLARLLLALAAMNFGLAVVREALSLWTPTLLKELCGLAADDAVRASALLPLVSGIGALLAGALADRGPKALLSVTLLPCLAGASALAVVAVQASASEVSFAAMMTAIALASASLAMPMTLASGVLPLRAAATGGARRLGLVDGAGSLGAVLAGGVLARVKAGFGSSGMFITLAAVALLAAVLAIVVHRVTAARGAATRVHR